MNNEKELHLSVCMSDSYLPIYEKIFSRTLPREFKNVNILHVRDYDGVPGNVGEDNFKVINYKKLEFISQQIERYQGDNLLVLDLDIVCFRDFKQEINDLLEEYDMVFQHNPNYDNRHMPYCVGVWALQCSEKNRTFFQKEVMPRAQPLLFTKDEINDLAMKKTKLPGYWFHRLGCEPGDYEHYDGDQCVVNAAILEGNLGKELNVGLLPDTYTAEGDIRPNREECVIYHAAGSAARGTQQKAKLLVDTYEKIKKNLK